ncbi:MAG: hypothetical protein A2445_05095 [Candidatus Jacksonbacteria bacterium RIFOXYC2_FULL_44_29]|nr:MAG: Thymidylate kinase [Parcubacteria group bacterium GW2011_GWC2_44_22]OGY75721.1 MAG: hypothetical protein A2240_06240 [Candidatus Jacksonbacteria bacterium RIFOXYA2_FULL_43_12]OGY76287.1 MAG: hypothetical protein A2295_00725 [Candidatus Jacksonbacteria bacterium RIFOXYB2_FULL_44_15]OGY78113.1 MAG: hypothetical protein A2445_05095 [Candidatus Jacksonbacteria bacterium RIFOXYC2_FULL_44_29]OGY80978.1 MAG: hypothetical protein A2550_02950 [Candidatus Jacksonbacteria bacterium RIFOXYD2_FULL_4
MLIVIDGIDGTGKTTQTEYLIKNLKKAGYAVETLDFPHYQNFFGQMVRQYLAGEFGNIDQVDPHLATMLYALDRWQTKNKIQKWLKQKKVVVLARYTTANLIHQAIKVPASKRADFQNWIENLEYEILGLPKPDLVVCLYLPARMAYTLITKRGRPKDIHEADIMHLNAAANQALKLCRQHKTWRLLRCHRGNTILSREEVAKQLWRLTAPFI